MKEFEVYWNDLTEKAKKALLDAGYQWNQNMEIYPITILSQESMEDEDE